MSPIPLENEVIYLFMGALIGVSAFLQGVGGVGFTMFAAPVALVIAPELVPGPLLTLGGAVTLLTAVRERYRIVLPLSLSAIGGRAFGSMIAVVVLGSLKGGLLNLAFAGLILGAVLLSVSGWKVVSTRGNLGVAGLVSGVMGTLTSVGSPPLVIALQYNEPAMIRANVGAILAIGAWISIGLLAVTGHYGVHDLWLSALLLPFLVVGFVLSNPLRRFVRGPALRKALLVFCAASAGWLILKTVAF